MLRRATDADSADIRRWRNHPEVRRVSLTQHVITEDEHARWWAAVAQDDTREVWVYERSGVPSGVVNFFDVDRDAGSASWGYFLDNDGLTERGQLLPAFIQVQREAKKLAFGEMGLSVLEGEVLEHNESVRAFNRRNGFEEVGSEVRDVDGTPTTVLRIRATKPEPQPDTAPDTAPAPHDD